MPAMKFAFLFSALAFALLANAQKRPSRVVIDSLPESQIDIPIQINLRTIYTFAERNVDTVFSSPNYPNDWIEADCATRYKYRFRRSPLKMAMNGSTLYLSFLGYYQVIGSTRACVNGTILSPWTPSCRCGVDETERRVNVGFTSTFKLLPNHVLNTKIICEEPQALDKCTVCFWGQDVTTNIMEGLKSALVLSKKEMEASFGRISLRGYMQQAWNLLNEVYTIPNVGYLSLHPKKLRMQNINAQNDWLKINIGISASPVISFSRPETTSSAVPDLTQVNHPEGFNIYLEAALQYDSLSKILNSYLENKRFDVSDGLIKKHIIIKEVSVSGNERGSLLIRVDFSGSYNGSVFFAGTPVYNPEKRAIEVHNLDYDLKTKSLLLKTAKWLYTKRISKELKKYTYFELTDYYTTASSALNSWLNQEWTRGVKGSGSISDLRLTEVHALPEHLLIRSNCAGKLSVMVSEIDLKL
jgi:hypothetical protein